MGFRADNFPVLSSFLFPILPVDSRTRATPESPLSYPSGRLAYARHARESRSLGKGRLRRARVQDSAQRCTPHGGGATGMPLLRGAAPSRVPRTAEDVAHRLGRAPACYRTADSDSASPGSNPSPPARLTYYLRLIFTSRDAARKRRASRGFSGSSNCSVQERAAGPRLSARQDRNISVGH